MLVSEMDVKCRGRGTTPQEEPPSGTDHHAGSAAGSSGRHFSYSCGQQTLHPPSLHSFTPYTRDIVTRILLLAVLEIDIHERALFHMSTR